jgi:hypothetical protein
MTTRGFSTEAAKRMPLGGHGHLPVAPVEPAIDAVVKAIEKRAKRVVSPRWVSLVMPFGALVPHVIRLQVSPRKLDKTLEIARQEQAGLTTEQE